MNSFEEHKQIYRKAELLATWRTCFEDSRDKSCTSAHYLPRGTHLLQSQQRCLPLYPQALADPPPIDAKWQSPPPHKLTSDQGPVLQVAHCLMLQG